MKSILIANRGEIAVRIAQACAELGIESVAVYPEDDAASLHVRRADRAILLPGKGPESYLSIKNIITAAHDAGCDGVHPGYGFLAESAKFAESLRQKEITFIGPTPETLAQLGNKKSALALAHELNVPINPGLDAGASANQISEFMAEIGGPVILKAVAGGGGRGMRIIRAPAEIIDALEIASQEAEATFGNGDIFVEKFVERARHIEVQIIGDGHKVVHVWERDCTLQRRHQKILEIAPAPNLSVAARQAMLDASVKIASATNYHGLGTFEFLLDGKDNIAFIEANPRVQVEHTVTEEVAGIDLVQTQIRICAGATIADLGLEQHNIPEPSGHAVQMRVNLERITEDGKIMPTGGLLSAYEQPGGPGVRVDGHGYAGLKTSPLYDNLLAKVICHAPEKLDDALARCRRALRAFRIEGVETNIPFLHALLDLHEIESGSTFTRQIEEQSLTLFKASMAAPETLAPATAHAFAMRRAMKDENDPLGVLDYGRNAANHPGQSTKEIDDPGTIKAPMQGTIVSVEITESDPVSKGMRLFTIESMKMEHAIRADFSGIVRQVIVKKEETLFEGDLMAVIEPKIGKDDDKVVTEHVDLERIRPDLKELHDRKALLQDLARPDAVAKRHKLGKNTARENVDYLTDKDSFIEYGDLVYAAQKFRRSKEDLIRNTPADGLVTGIGTINAKIFGAKVSRTAVMAYDYTVLAGTQGIMNHEKKDRMIDVIRRQKLPLVFFCEGGGGRPGDVDASETMIAGLFMTTFWHYAQLSGLVPMVGIGSGRLFAGNAALLGCCDVIIATRDTCLGMGGPAMIEGGGLGLFRPEEVGPMDVQVPNGCVDILVENEIEGIEVAKKYLSYFQGSLSDWTAPDQRILRHVVPENRLEVYDIRKVLNGLADIGSVLELRKEYGKGIVTALARIEGRTVGIFGNNPIHLSGAIDSAGADKAARFIKLCDAFDIPLVTLIDTPGMMVGPEVEKTALVRHCCRLFLAGGNITVPLVSIITRKFYGLGAQAMAGGSSRTAIFVIGWPTAEIGGMGLEGAVKLGYRKELEAIEDLDERKIYFEKMVADSYERGKAVNAASILEFDTVIDPIDTRKWIVAAMDSAPSPIQRDGKKHAFVDSW